MSEPVTFVIPIYPGVTHLDFTGPHQFFSRFPQARVVVASKGGAPVEADGLTFSDLADLSTVADCTVLCVPGGAACVSAMDDPLFLAEIRRLAENARYVTSVCTGSLLLAAAGLITGKRAACHWMWRDMLSAFGAIPDDGRIVRDGRFMTGGGVTAGIDLALAIIAEISGVATAQAIQLALEYAPEPPFDAGRPETAPAAVCEAVTGRRATEMAGNRARIEAIAAAGRLVA